MNAAVETSRADHQRRRSPGMRRSGATGEGIGDALLPVLIRLPNLDAPRPSARAASHKADSSATATGESEASRISTRPNATAAASPARNSTSQLLGWLWRMMILAAAVGLVILAYRVINGPLGALPELDEAPMNMEAVAGTHDAQSIAPTLGSPVPSGQLALPAGEIAAPATLAPPQLELEAAPIEVSPLQENAHPHRHGSQRLASDLDDAPRNQRRPWATENDPPQPRDDGAVRTARSEWGDGWSHGEGDDQPSAHDGYEHRRDEGWDTTDQPAPSFDYPETSPNTWRDEGRWESTPRGAPPGDAAAMAPARNEPGHRAMRPSEPGVARLHGEIEQPPLRRDDERNRPGIY